MTDSPFSHEEIEQARGVLRPYAGDNLDQIMKSVESVAERSRQGLVHTAQAVVQLLNAPSDPVSVPVLKRPRKVIVVAPTYRDACHYLRAVEAQPGTHLIAMEPHMVRALSPDDHVVVVTGFDPKGRLSAFTDYLRMSQAHVEYVNLDTIMGVNRDG